VVIFSAVTPDLIPNQTRIDPFCLEPKPVGVNQVMPRSAYQGQTPNEMFFGTGAWTEQPARWLATWHRWPKHKHWPNFG
jgi:hypothetical protein